MYSILDIKTHKEKVFKFDYKFKPRKVFLKTDQGFKYDIKTSAIRRDRNKDILDLYFNTVSKKGKKESYYKHFSIALGKLNEKYLCEKDYFSHHPRYYYYYYLSQEIYSYKNIENIILETLDDLQVLFIARYKKLDKEQRLKYKEKYKLEIKKVHPKKRYKHILSLLNKGVSEINSTMLSERIFQMFLDLCFNPKNSYISKRKIHIYTLILEDLKKKKE